MLIANQGNTSTLPDRKKTFLRNEKQKEGSQDSKDFHL